ncbi:DUF6894 family protein [Rhizobium leguminosarum]|uniref:DUF6894 family protein n=1 Tax=Rhizobium leguminosarum TaxID=384 RepID=UPI003D79A54C
MPACSDAFGDETSRYQIRGAKLRAHHEGDLEGIPFVTLQAAQRDARSSLFEMMAEDLKAGHLSNLLRIDITNRLEKVLAVIK